MGLVGSLLGVLCRPVGGGLPVSFPRFSKPVVASRGCFKGSFASGWELSGGSLGDPFWLEAAGLSFAPDWEPSGLLEHLTFLDIALGGSFGPAWEVWGSHSAAFKREHPGAPKVASKMGCLIRSGCWCFVSVIRHAWSWMLV